MQFQLADLATEIEAARLLTYNAARLRDTGASFVKEAAMAKLFASRTAEHVTSQGGRDLRRDTASAASTRWRSTSATRRSGQIYEGTSNMQRLVIAKQLLGKM